MCCILVLHCPNPPRGQSFQQSVSELRARWLLGFVRSLGNVGALQRQTAMHMAVQVLGNEERRRAPEWPWGLSSLRPVRAFSGPPSVPFLLQFGISLQLLTQEVRLRH